MALKPDEFSFSPRAQFNAFQSLSPYRSEELPESYMNTPRNLIEHLELKKERHEALRNYYLKVLAQLKDFTKRSLQQLEEQKNELIEELENKFIDSTKEVKRKALVKENELSAKLDEAIFHLESAGALLAKKQGIIGNDKQVIREAEENLKNWAQEVEVNNCDVLFIVPSLIVSSSEYSDYKAITKHVSISSMVNELSPIHSQTTGKLKLYVPFGYPEYSNYYLLNLSTQQPCSLILSALASYFNLEAVGLSYDQSLVQIQLNEKIHSNCQELYLIIN